MTRRIQIIDSHTGGEPTRTVVAGGPDVGGGPLAGRRELFASQFDSFRSTVINEPRGSDVIVGALLVPPTRPDCAAGVIFFNNVGYLGMCGHGAIGVAVTLGHLGAIKAGQHKLETPVGVVPFEFDGRHTVAIDNVPAYRHSARIDVEVPGFGVVTGDVAWGGNWFFLVQKHNERLELSNVDRLTDFTWRIRGALEAAGITGREGAPIDHIELFGAPADAQNQSRNFVLCPGRAYDRSPCGTGTSAKVACLQADGKLAPGEIWRQESIIGSVFEASFTLSDGVVLPRIRGTAYITSEATLLADPADPFREGIR